LSFEYLKYMFVMLYKRKIRFIFGIQSKGVLHLYEAEITPKEPEQVMLLREMVLHQITFARVNF